MTRIIKKEFLAGSMELLIKHYIKDSTLSLRLQTPNGNFRSQLHLNGLGIEDLTHIRTEIDLAIEHRKKLVIIHRLTGH